MYMWPNGGCEIMRELKEVLSLNMLMIQKSNITNKQIN